MFFHNFEINALYIAIPKLYDLKDNIINPIIFSKVHASTALLIIYGAIVLLTVLAPISMICLHKRARELNHHCHQLIEALNPHLIKHREDQVSRFLDKYTCSFG